MKIISKVRLGGGLYNENYNSSYNERGQGLKYSCPIGGLNG